MKIDVSDELVTELQYIVDLHKEHGAPNPFVSVPQLVNYVLAAIADGSRRPGSWEREILEQMGLVADTPKHRVYRAAYGPAPAIAGDGNAPQTSWPGDQQSE